MVRRCSKGEKHNERLTKIQQFAENIFELVSCGCLYSALTNAIAQAGLAGQEHPEDYWTNHLARLVTPGFIKMNLPGEVVMDEDGLSQLIGMDESTLTGLSALGVTGADVP